MISFPKVSIVQEKRFTAPTDWLAKTVLNEDDYIAYKNGKYENDLELRKYVKKYLTFNLDKLSVTIHVDNANNEVTNALQRASTTEQNGYGLDVEYGDVSTNDENMNITELIKNIQLLPLRNGISQEEIDAIDLSINIKNTTNNVLAISAGDMIIKSYKIKEHLFYNSTTLIYLNIGKSLTVNNIRIKEGNVEEDTRYLTATNGAIFPLDLKKDSKTPHSRYMKHEITFKVNAISKNEKSRDVTKRILIGGCDDLIKRLQIILQIVNEDDVLYTQKFDDAYILKVEETNSIAKLLERICFNIYPEVEYITAEIIYDTKIMTLHIKGSDARNMLLTTIVTAIKIYENIKQQFITYQ